MLRGSRFRTAWSRRAAVATACGLLAILLASCGVTHSATAVTETTATLNGQVNPQGVQTSWWFQYGTSTSYGSETTHHDAGAGNAFVTVSEAVTGLTGGKTYHFRLCTATTGASSCAADVTFDTPPPRIPGGFSESVAFRGLTQPTAMRFAPDGRVFVAEKSGLIKVFDGLGDTTPTVFADLRTEVHNFWDRGLLGLALDPQFPAAPVRLRALHLRRGHRRHGAALGHAGATSDGCPTPPGPDRRTAAW